MDVNIEVDNIAASVSTLVAAVGATVGTMTTTCSSIAFDECHQQRYNRVGQQVEK